MNTAKGPDEENLKERRTGAWEGGCFGFKCAVILAVVLTTNGLLHPLDSAAFFLFAFITSSILFSTIGVIAGYRFPVAAMYAYLITAFVPPWI